MLMILNFSIDNLISHLVYVVYFLKSERAALASAALQAACAHSDISDFGAARIPIYLSTRGSHTVGGARRRRLRRAAREEREINFIILESVITR